MTPKIGEKRQSGQWKKFELFFLQQLVPKSWAARVFRCSSGHCRFGDCSCR